MKAVRLYKAGDLRVEDIPAPGPLVSGSVRITVKAAGICGSDLHNFRTGQWISRSPSVAGHEFAGVITEIAADVMGLRVGDLVAADSRYWCGDCAACRSGRRNVCEKLGFVGEVCDGGFAEECVLPARLVTQCPSALAPEIAAMAEPLAVALHAVKRLRLPGGEPVLVAGCGPIGGLAALLLSRLHDGPILIAERNTARAALVGDVAGARSVDLDAALIEAALDGRPLRYALDATGSIGALDALINLLSGGGALALVGISHGQLTLDPNLLVEREIALIGCHAFEDELPEAVAMMPDLADALGQLIETRISLDATPDAYRRLLDGHAAGLKTIIIPELGGDHGQPA
ncbi:alcohol dehydrogenase catalytic domain-containing protein [Rhizobium sp. FKL33]|jgi:(R,R)-butanediol dehydrogenase/meso-butanediol dehydrogenase/diacetyl reductase|uniref:zinc-dependent alcohol dehydrogenase n=1 Tax=Rhizobium sp. FKL33 TaxID=2562307 RepID=UPI0010C0F155|nr:alcohol dehydrogenase catalytic domain-containing protein [Rhizobium sp. FKL33]